jgi:hypothetical protein
LGLIVAALGFSSPSFEPAFYVISGVSSVITGLLFIALGSGLQLLQTIAENTKSLKQAEPIEPVKARKRHMGHEYWWHADGKVEARIDGELILFNSFEEFDSYLKQ